MFQQQQKLNHLHAPPLGYNENGKETQDYTRCYQRRSGEPCFAYQLAYELVMTHCWKLVFVDAHLYTLY